MNHVWGTFSIKVGLAWRVGARAPVMSGAAATALVLLLVLLVAAAMSGAASPSGFAIYMAVFGLLFGIRPAWLAWHWWRHSVQQGPPRIVLDRRGVSVVADGHTTQLSWADVDWIGAMTGVPPRGRALTLVASLRPGAEAPPLGYQWNRHRYDPRPRSYAHLGVVRLIDLTLLAADPSDVAAAADWFSGGKWRGDHPAGRSTTHGGQ